MDLKRELIKTIKIEPSNLKYCAENNVINGTLLLEIERIMQIHTDKQLILHGVIPMLLCVDDCGVRNRLSEGKKYEIEADNDETYTIYDDLGTMNLFDKERFKVVP